MNTSVAFIGMSNTGKSRFATPKLEALGFTKVCVDDEIEKRLGPELVKLGYSGIEEMAKWMGQPFEEQYSENSTTYLEHEIEVMWQVLGRLKRGERLVIDTTGSVIYTGSRILEGLREQATIVLLDAPQELQDELLVEYLTNPKPRIWGDDTYRPWQGEEPMEALKRCFPDLLAMRYLRYHKLAHFTIDYRVVRNPAFTGQTLLDMIGVVGTTH
ncbi:MAG: hypothetical protein Q7R67_02740 [bacterium]|nr:hypothetical protein [bacterium]